MKDKNKIIMQLHKPSPKNKIFPVIQKRWSPRFFSAEEIPAEHLKIFFEAVRWTPSARNHQPWFFYYTHKGTDSYKKIFSTLSEHNRLWAGSANVYIVACAQVRNQFGENPFVFYDLGAAVFALVLQAQELGYYSRQMAMFDKEKLYKILKLDKEYQPYIVVAMGKLGDYRKAPQEIIEKEMEKKTRKSLDSICKKIWIKI